MEAIYTNATNAVSTQRLIRDRKLTYIICFSKDENSDVMWKHDGKVNDIRINPEQKDDSFKSNIEEILSSYGYNIPVS